MSCNLMSSDAYVHQVGDDEVKMLVWDLEARVELQDGDGWTCAHWAAQHGRPGALRAVLDGIMGLSSELEAGRETVAEFLSVRDNEGKTAADVARSCGHIESMLKELLDVMNIASGNETGDSAMASLD